MGCKTCPAVYPLDGMGATDSARPNGVKPTFKSHFAGAEHTAPGKFMTPGDCTNAVYFDTDKVLESLSLLTGS